jgi:casein kinase II subunit alpha
MLPLLFPAVLGSTYTASSTPEFQIDSHDLYDDYPITYHNTRTLTLLDSVGHGRFSQVYRAMLSNGTVVAAKCLRPTQSWRLKREVHFLELLQGVPHVVDFIGVYGDEYSPIVVTEFATRDNETNLSLEDLKWAMRCLLTTLNATHYRHVFHRDIKWQNLMVSFKNRTIKVIDWGLAEYVVRDRKLPSRVGTRSYKAPELLLGAELYGPEVDVWAAGVILANLMFGSPSFFRGAEDRVVLDRQTQVFGYRRMSRLAKEFHYKRRVTHRDRQSLLEFALPHTRRLITRDGLDLLEQMMMPERRSRVTAADALIHPFFTS